MEIISTNRGRTGGLAMSMGNYTPCKWCGKDMSRMGSGSVEHEAECHMRTVPCQFCGMVTHMLITKQCDNCYGVHSRIGSMPISVLNKIVKSARSKS